MWKLKFEWFLVLCSRQTTDGDALTFAQWRQGPAPGSQKKTKKKNKAKQKNNKDNGWIDECIIEGTNIFFVKVKLKSYHQLLTNK